MLSEVGFYRSLGWKGIRPYHDAETKFQRRIVLSCSFCKTE